MKKQTDGQVFSGSRLSTERAMEILSLGNVSAVDRQSIDRAFRKQLFAIHPDTSRITPEITVDDLIRARNHLHDCLEYKEQQNPARSGLQSGQTDREAVHESTAAGSGREKAFRQQVDGYEDYRHGMDLFSKAMQDYFNSRKKYSSLPENSTEFEIIYERFREAKKVLARVLEYPGSIWTSDAVETIARINLWVSHSTPETRFSDEADGIDQGESESP